MACVCGWVGCGGQGISFAWRACWALLLFRGAFPPLTLLSPSGALSLPPAMFCSHPPWHMPPWRRDDIVPGIMESSWRSALTLLLFDAFTVTSHGGRIAVLCFMYVW